MQITVQSGALEKSAADAVVVALFQDVRRPTGAAAAVDAVSGHALRDFLATGDFTGKKHQVAVLYPKSKTRFRRILLVGLGPEGELTLDGVRQAVGRAVGAARSLEVDALATAVVGAGRGGLEAREAAQAVAEGLILANYGYERYRTRADDKRHALRKALVVESDRAKLAAVRRGVERGRAGAEAACFTRDLCNSPSLDLTPRAFAQRARQLANARAGVRVQVFDEARIRALKMGCLLGVAKGSDEPPRFLVFDYRPKGRPKATLCLVGKGITFDTGGISLKPAEGMDRMKYDMSGAAAVAGVFHALSHTRPAVRVIGLTPMTENMPGGHAIKPGDVLTAMNGVTVEVNNTDAEGRLVLADGLSYAQRFQPDVIIDLATLTGACVIALGAHASGLMGNDERLIERIRAAGDRTGERAWPLPTWPAYKDLLKSEVADIKNSAGREAGTIAGAMFLENFVNGKPWAHLDIAGTAWAEKERPYVPKGSVGYGVRLLLDLIENWK